MSQTTVGQNRCGEGELPERPFVIEWDATDLATFEAIAERDVVFVRYENCELEVLDRCSDRSISGKYGVYLPPRWTSGGVEGFDIESEAELHARLPLSIGTFGAQVAAGKSLHLSYFVSGTSLSDRGEVYADEIGANSNCTGATHFVASFNLGAFELSTKSEFEGGAEATVEEVSIGGHQKSSNRRLKQGGKMASCEANSATELRSCRVPIRLGLRELTPGAPPEAPPSLGTASSGAAGSAAPAARDSGHDGEAGAKLRASAREKSKMGDGKGCLADLAEAAKVDPQGIERSAHHQTHGICLMQTGECDAGRREFREAYESINGGNRLTEAQLDQATAVEAAKQCPPDLQTPTERSLSLGDEIRKAKRTKNVGRSAHLGRELMAIIPKLSKQSADDEVIWRSALNSLSLTVDVLARGGDCTTAKEFWLFQQKQYYPDPKQFESQSKRFSRTISECSE